MSHHQQQKRRHFLWGMALAAVVLAVVGIRYAYARYAPAVHITDGRQHFIYIDRDDTQDSVLVKIDREQVMNDLRTFRRLVRKTDYAQQIRTGCYELKDGMSNAQLLRYLRQGYQTPVKLTFNNIRTQGALAKRLSAQLMLDSTEIVAALNDSVLLSRYELTPETATTLFSPNTYEVYWDMNVASLFKLMDKESRRFWTEARRRKAAETGLTPVQVSILASIVDEETNNLAEKPTIAGLYLNRLRKGMLLQADPTVRFAWQDFTIKRVLRAQLAINSPYNTYKYAGLPPGAIRIPSAEGIDAVLNYEKHNYLYMCANADFSGTHCFARTMAEHDRNAVRYRKALNKLNIKK